jgi:hypothetical protein
MFEEFEELEGKELEDKSESDLITEVSDLVGEKFGAETAKMYLAGVMENLRSGQEIKYTAGHLRGYFLQAITRDEGKRRKAADLVVQLLGHIGESEASYFSNHLNDMEAEFQEEGRSWFEKKTQLISDLTKLSNSLDRKNLMKEADKVDAILEEFAAQDD